MSNCIFMEYIARSQLLRLSTWFSQDVPCDCRSCLGGPIKPTYFVPGQSIQSMQSNPINSIPGRRQSICIDQCNSIQSIQSISISISYKMHWLRDWTGLSWFSLEVPLEFVGLPRQARLELRRCVLACRLPRHAFDTKVILCGRRKIALH